MPPANRSRAHALVMGLLLVALSLAPHSLAGAQADELPPDDGAPPSDYEPVPGSELLELQPDGQGELLVDDPAALPSSPPVDNAFPIAGSSRSSCSNNFGAPRSGGRTHLGVDCFAPVGTPLVAVESGAIRYATAGDPFSCVTGGDISGNRVSLRGRSGYVYYYGHLDTIAVATDQVVEKGQVIGTLGRTGNASCSTPHLHLEVKCGEHGDPFDPYPLLANWGRVTLPATRWPSTNALGAGVLFSGPGRQDLFVLECGQAIRHKVWWSSTGVSPWSPVPGIASSDPDAASPGAGWDPQVFVRGADNAVYQLYWSGSSWFVPSLGGNCTSGPSAVYSSPTHLDVFCAGSDQAIYQRFWDASTGWSPGWSRVGGITTSDPDAASAGPNYPAHLFVRGSDDAIYQMYSNGSAWVVGRLGGICSSGPSAAYSGPDRLDVFCRGADLAIWHRYWRSDTGWSSGWTRIESQIMSDPEAASYGPAGHAQVFARGLDRRLYQFYWNGSVWVGSIWGVT